MTYQRSFLAEVDVRLEVTYGSHQSSSWRSSPAFSTNLTFLFYSITPVSPVRGEFLEPQYRWWDWCPPTCGTESSK